jgi:anti-sigma28 factor (negative regulator of flagellin synthesis)
MRINESFSAPVSTGRTTGTAAAGADGAAAQAQGSSAEDRVALSSASSLVSRAIDTASSERAARLQSIAAQVRAGTYNVSAQALSNSLVSSMLGGD